MILWHHNNWKNVLNNYNNVLNNCNRINLINRNLINNNPGFMVFRVVDYKKIKHKIFKLEEDGIVVVDLNSQI